LTLDPIAALTGPLFPPRYLLDTNVLLAYARENEVYQKIEALYGLLPLSAATGLPGTPSQAPLVSVVSVAEVLGMAQFRGWGGPKTAKLATLLARFPSVPIQRSELLDRYARIYAFSRRSGFDMAKSQNDLWIAATASLTGAILLTTDKDFGHLDPVFLKREWIDPNTRS
jgi:predicted nucleic acid-binding protein